MTGYNLPSKVEDYQKGAVWECGPSAYYVPDAVAEEHDEETDQLVQAAFSHSLDTPEGIAEFAGNVGGRTRDALENATLWALLNDRVNKYDPLEHDDLGATLASDVRVPMRVVSEGPASIAAYLAAFDHSNSSIASALDVGERTVSQYLSDFKKGER